MFSVSGAWGNVLSGKAAMQEAGLIVDSRSRYLVEKWSDYVETTLKGLCVGFFVFVRFVSKAH